MFSLAGKVAVITGGGSGIGEAICKCFAEAGAFVYVVDRDAGGGTRVSDEIRSTGRAAHFLEGDVSRDASCRDVAKRVLAETGDRCDILVNNAGIGHVGTLLTTTGEDLDRLYAVNVKGVYNALKAAVPAMKGRGGAIVNVASVAATVGIPDRFAYSMTKGAVLTMTYSVARDYIHEKIRCNAVSPARVHTPFVDGFLARNYAGREAEMFERLSQSQPIGRMGRPDEVADLTLFLCSDAAAFITGSNYTIDGGFVTLKM